MVSVLAVDDEPPALDELVYLLERDPHVDRVVSANDGTAALRVLEDDDVDVVVLDIRMPGISGLEVLDTVLAAEPDTQVAMLTTSELEEDVYRAMTHGARGFIRKDARGAELIAGVRAVAGGEKYLPENLKAVFEMRADQKALSPRELDVLRLASKGYRNNEIARLAGISVNTLKYHLKNAFDKLGVTSRTEAVTEAIHRGIIES